jgi:hypothetical protein
MNPVDAAIAAVLRGESGANLAAAADRVLERAQFHGVAGLLELRLGAQAPEALRGPLHQAAVLAAAFELARRDELARLLATLDAAGVPAVLLKGVPLAHWLYAQPYARPSLDADLMVAPPLRRRAREVLLARGYQTTRFQGGELINAQAAYWRRLTAEVPMLLDLHWRISTSALFANVLTFDWLRSRARPIPALGPAAFGPAPVDALLHACVHRAGVFAQGSEAERADRLIWLHDIHLLAAALDVREWSEFSELAARHRLRAICRDALQAARCWFATRVPDAVWAALAGTGDEPSAALLEGGALRLKWAEFRGLPDLGQRLGWLRETALPAPAYLLDLYRTDRRWLLPALYVRRALGWLAR